MWMPFRGRSSRIQLSRTPKATKRLNVRTVEFVGEQDGPIERELKARLLPLLLRDDRIGEAYLVRATYDDDDQVVVVLAVDRDRPDSAFVDSVAATFATLFRYPEHLDTLFLKSSDKERIRIVCRPFFIRALE